MDNRSSSNIMAVDMGNMEDRRVIIWIRGAEVADLRRRCWRVWLAVVVLMLACYSEVQWDV